MKTVKIKQVKSTVSVYESTNLRKVILRNRIVEVDSQIILKNVDQSEGKNSCC